MPLNFPPKKTLTKKKGQICPLPNSQAICLCSGSTCIVVDASISWKFFFAVQNKSCKRTRTASAQRELRGQIASREGKARAARAKREPRGQSASREGKARAHLLPRQGRARLPRPLGLRAAAPMLGLRAAAPIVRVVCSCPNS